MLTVAAKAGKIEKFPRCATGWCRRQSGRVGQRMRLLRLRKGAAGNKGDTTTAGAAETELITAKRMLA